MKTVFDLTEEQIEFLKEAYATQLLEADGEDMFWGDLASAPDEIQDEVIFNHYDGVTFSDEDFA